MVKSSRANTWGIAFITGVFLGFLSLFFREMGIVIGLVFTTVLAAFYVTHGRVRDVGWYLVGAGAVPTLLLGRNVLNSFLDSAVRVYADTWLLLSAYVLVLAFGIVVVGASGSSNPPNGRVEQ
jgi:hypothetical protein